MQKRLIKEINIPEDEDNFIVQKCPSCGEKFMTGTKEFKSKEQLDIWCPGCGLIHSNYLTDEYKEVIQNNIDNYLHDIISKHFKKVNSINCKKKTSLKKLEIEYNNFELKVCQYCNKAAKIDPILKFTGGYCPFCGEHLDGEN